LLSESLVSELQLATDIEDAGAFRGGPARHSVEARFVVGFELACTFGGVVDDRQGSSAKLIFQVAPTGWHLLEDAIGDADKLNRRPVGVEFLVIELVHAYSIVATTRELRIFFRGDRQPASAP
jgi:hypothetical protein